MKYATLIAFGLFAAHISCGQKMEYSIHLNSGGAAYRGSGASRASSILVADIVEVPAYTNNPYGKRLGFCYGLAGQIQRITPKHSVFGVQAGYEVLQSRIAITEVYGFRSVNPAASGHTTLTNKTINVHPFFGHRLALKSVDVDAQLGPELGVILSAREKGEATLQGQEYSTDAERSHPSIDFRARLQLTAYYKRAGLSAGYSRGLTNYYAGYDGSTSSVYSQVFRLGLAYRI